MTFETHHNGNLPELDYETLRDAVQGGANYLRIRTKLQPADKAGGKVYPPTYAGPEGSHRADEPRYHIEERRSDGETVLAVVLDSVPSQANRAEEALLDAYEDGLVKFPFVEADFSLSADDDSENADYDGIRPGRLTALEASHRAADAVFRECEINGERFRDSPVGQAIFSSHERDAEGVYRYCPTVLVFGEWDSMGGDAARGHKFERRVVSEIVAIGAVPGRASAGKLDPLKIESAKVYKNKAHEKDPSASPWTTNEEEAVCDKKGPVLYGKDKGKGKMSGLGLGNVTPSVAASADGDFTGSGGVTFSRAEQTTVIALNSIRRLRFPRHREAAVDARTAVAALTLAAIVFRDAQGYALRSRCLLVADGRPSVELVGAYGDTRVFAPVTLDSAARMLKSAADAAAKAGLAWESEPVVLTPNDALRKAVRDSKAVHTDEDAGR